MSPLAGKTIFMSGGSRGIGLAIAVRAARDGANVAIMAKTDAPQPTLEGTVHTAAAEIEAAGGQALAVVGDVRDADAVVAADRRALRRHRRLRQQRELRSTSRRSPSCPSSAST